MTDIELFGLLSNKLRSIPGGYNYEGMISSQICFPLKAGGELRFMLSENEQNDGCTFTIDHYDGSIPPGVTGPATRTGA